MYIYFIHTSTTSLLSKTIGLYTKNKYNHVSLSFNQELNDVYSFGRKQINNPLVGGFVKEDFKTGLFINAHCSVYRLAVSEAEYINMKAAVMAFEEKCDQLRYNFLGLVFLSCGWDIKREDYYFCSEFASTIIQLGTLIVLPKPAHFMLPQDLARLSEMELFYEGPIATYIPQKQFLSLNYKLKCPVRNAK